MISHKVSKKEKVLNYLKKNRADGYNTLSHLEIFSKFGVSNPSRLISTLRKEGYPIYANERKRRDGTTATVYRLGTPSKSMLKEFKTKKIKLQLV